MNIGLGDDICSAKFFPQGWGVIDVKNPATWVYTMQGETLCDMSLTYCPPPCNPTQVGWVRDDILKLNKGSPSYNALWGNQNIAGLKIRMSLSMCVQAIARGAKYVPYTTPETVSAAISQASKPDPHYTFQAGGTKSGNPNRNPAGHAFQAPHTGLGDLPTHTVQAGEKLSDIARSYGLCTTDIVAMNPHKEATIAPGIGAVFLDLEEGETLRLPSLQKLRRKRIRIDDGEDTAALHRAAVHRIDRAHTVRVDVAHPDLPVRRNEHHLPTPDAHVRLASINAPDDVGHRRIDVGARELVLDGEPALPPYPTAPLAADDERIPRRERREHVFLPRRDVQARPPLHRHIAFERHRVKPTTLRTPTRHRDVETILPHRSRTPGDLRHKAATRLVARQIRPHLSAIEGIDRLHVQQARRIEPDKRHDR